MVPYPTQSKRCRSWASVVARTWNVWMKEPWPVRTGFGDAALEIRVRTLVEIPLVTSSKGQSTIKAVLPGSAFLLFLVSGVS
jgi:hypothetical protein